MKRRIFGFQRRVWWPKWTPASSSSRMETTAMVFLSVGLGRAAGGVGAHRPQRPAPRHGVIPPGRRDWSGKSSRRPPNGGETLLAPRCGKRRLEVGRERRAHVHLLPGERVLEGEPGRVEELPLEPELAGGPVCRVAGH